MSNLTKRFFSLLLAAVMCVSLLPAVGLAAQEGESEPLLPTANLLAEVAGHSATVAGLDGPLSGSTLVLPAKIDGKPLTRIEAGAFRGVEGLRRVIIPASVTSIGDEAFCGCPNLLDAEFLGEAPGTFGQDVFLHCAKDFAMWHRTGEVHTYCVLHGYPYYYLPETLESVYHSFSGKNIKNAVKTVPTNVEITDALFEGEAVVFNYDLARLSLCFAMASSVNFVNGGTVADVKKYDTIVGYDAFGSTESPYNRPDRFLRQCLESAGFENDYYQYRYSDTSSEENDEAYGIAWKRLDDGTNLVALVIRSNGYGGGWVSNVTVSGAADWARGFYESARSIIYGGTESQLTFAGGEKEQNPGLLAYLEQHGLSPENTRIWVSGFSRGGAVANCIGGILQAESEYNAENDNLFVYTFATPRTVEENAVTQRNCPSVFNIVQEMDLVPQMPLDSWGFKRFGTTYALPCRSLLGKAYRDRLAEAGETFFSLMQHFGYANEYSPIDGQEQIVDELTKIMYTGVPDVSVYQRNFEDALQTACSVFIAKNPGTVDTDAIIAYLAGEDALDDLMSLYQRVIVNKEKLSAKEIAGYARRLNDELELAPLRAMFSELSSYILRLLSFNGFDRAKAWLTGKGTDASSIGKNVKYVANMYSQGFDSEALIQHWPEEYYSWLNSGTAADTLTTVGYKRYSGRCPIDMTVYDSSGTVVAQVTDEQVIVSDLLILMGLDGEKTIIIPEDQPYRVVTTAREGDAAMDVTVERCAFDGSLVQKDIYRSIPLAQGAQFTADVAPDANPSIVTDAGDTLTPDQTLTENKLCSVDASYTGDGVVLGNGSYLEGDAVTLVAVCDDGLASTGWYDAAGNRLSDEPCFKFTAGGDASLNTSFVKIPTLTLDQEILAIYPAGSKQKLSLTLSDEYWRDFVEWVAVDAYGNVSEEHPQSNDVISVSDGGDVTVVGRGVARVEARIRIGSTVVKATCWVNAGQSFVPPVVSGASSDPDRSNDPTSNNPRPSFDSSDDGREDYSDASSDPDRPNDPTSNNPRPSFDSSDDGGEDYSDGDEPGSEMYAPGTSDT